MKRQLIRCIYQGDKKPNKFIFVVFGIDGVPDGEYNITNGLPSVLARKYSKVSKPYGVGWGLEKHE